MGQHGSRNVGARRPVAAAPWAVRDIGVETGGVGLHRASGVQEQQSGLLARHGGDELLSGIESRAQAAQDGIGFDRWFRRELTQFLSRIARVPPDFCDEPFRRVARRDVDGGPNERPQVEGPSMSVRRSTMSRGRGVRRRSSPF